MSAVTNSSRTPRREDQPKRFEKLKDRLTITIEKSTHLAFKSLTVDSKDSTGSTPSPERKSANIENDNRLD